MSRRRSRNPLQPACLGLVFALGCADTTNPPQVVPPDEYLGLVVPGDGFQIRNAGAVIPPGGDLQYCQIAEVPGDSSDTYYVKGLELGNAEFGHHVMVSTAKPGTELEETLRSMQVGDQVECFSAQIEWGTDQLEVLAGIQQPYGRVDYPDGIGNVFSGGQRLIFDYHYINPTTEPIDAKSALNIHLTLASKVEHIVRGSLFINFLIDVPPRSPKSFTAECAFRDDVILGGVQRHTHQNGTNFSVWFRGGPRDGEHIWTSKDWKHDLGHVLPEPVEIRAGEGLRFECGFENATDRQIRYGMNGTDEMCILGGTFWTAADDSSFPTQDCDVVWADDQGVGHPAAEAGGFPAASASDSALCRVGLSLVGSAVSGADDCSQCLCDSCATVLLNCVADEECSALLGCFTSGCDGLDACMNACESEMDRHSSAFGLLKQVEGCVSHSCSSCSPW